VNDLLKNFFKFLLGFAILIMFYLISDIVVKIFHIVLPPAILGLILFAFCLIQGFIKEEWIKSACEFLINNMAMFLVPFLAGLIVYKALLLKNWFVIFVVIFITTTLVLIVTGLFVEWGIKFLRLHKMKEVEGSSDD
jgi:holin-like protein